MGIRFKVSAEVWTVLMKRMDDRQCSLVGVAEFIKAGYDRSAIWKALKDLEGQGLIRKRGFHWDEVWINPEVVRCCWLDKAPEKLVNMIAGFKQEASAFYTVKEK
jgi:hypothetical protein